MLRATLNQKRYIRYINKKLGLSEKESNEILHSIKTFHDADRYIKKYAPLVRFKSLSFRELLLLARAIRLKVKNLSREVLKVIV